MSVHYRFSEVLDSLPAEKRKQDGTVSRFFLRPLSFPFTWLFLNTGFSPNGVTYLSMLFCLCGFVCALVPLMAFQYAAVGFFLLFGILDCADGNMARTIRARKAPDALSQSNGINFGEWVDALGGYFAYATMILAIGVSCAFVSGGLIPGTGLAVPGGESAWIILAAVTCAANLMMRLAFQSYRVVSGEKSRSGIGGEKKLSEEIGITGWFPVLYLAGIVTGSLPWVLAAYSLVYCGGCLLTVLKLVFIVERSKS